MRKEYLEAIEKVYMATTVERKGMEKYLSLMRRLRKCWLAHRDFRIRWSTVPPFLEPPFLYWIKICTLEDLKDGFNSHELVELFMEENEVN